MIGQSEDDEHVQWGLEENKSSGNEGHPADLHGQNKSRNSNKINNILNIRGSGIYVGSVSSP